MPFGPRVLTLNPSTHAGIRHPRPGCPRLRHFLSSQGQEPHVITSCPSRSYFDLHVIGIGYLNRIREVKPKKGDPFLACEIAALTGPSETPEYRRFDVRVTDSGAQDLIRSLAEPVSDRRRVMIGFRLSDL